MGISVTTLCQYFVNGSSEFAINKPVPTAVFESETATLRPCAWSESKTACGSCLIPLIASEMDEASLRPQVLNESRRDDGSDRASSMAFASNFRSSTLRDEVTLPISTGGGMSGS